MIHITRGKKRRGSDWHEFHVINDDDNRERITESLTIITRGGDRIMLDMPDKKTIQVWSWNNDLRIL